MHLFHQAFLLSNSSEILEPALTVPLAAIHKDLKGYQVNTLDVRKTNNTQNKYQKTSDILKGALWFNKNRVNFTGKMHIVLGF